MDIINKIKNNYNNSSDLIIKKIKKIYIVYLESLCDISKINDLIIKNYELKNDVISPKTTLIKQKDIDTYLLNGFTIIIKEDMIYTVETKANLIRSVDKAETEVALFGPKDSFNESIENNLGLIKRRIKNNKLINDDYFIGENTKTKVSLLYIKDLCDDKIINKIKNKLSMINNDIISIGNLKQLLSKENRSFLPTMIESERPDSACLALLSNKAIILCDNSPFCLILPSFFTDFINPSVDNYDKNISINFIKILRFFCLLFTLLAPSLYIALINYNIETLPISLLINFSNQRKSVPFPSYIEAFIMLILCGILKESDMRFSSSYGSSISIVGALILGDAAVSAGLISPIMIIIISFTFISSLVFSDMEFVNGLRIYRFIILFLSTILGLYGFMLGFIILITNICSIKVLNTNYSYPLSPWNKNYFNKTLFKKPNKIKRRD